MKYIPSQGTLSTMQRSTGPSPCMLGQLREKRSGTKFRLRRRRLASLSADAFQGPCAGIYFTLPDRIFMEETGMTPREYREKAEREKKI